MLPWYPGLLELGRGAMPLVGGPQPLDLIFRDLDG